MQRKKVWLRETSQESFRIVTRRVLFLTSGSMFKPLQTALSFYTTSQSLHSGLHRPHISMAKFTNCDVIADIVRRDPTVFASDNSEGNFYWFTFVVVYIELPTTGRSGRIQQCLPQLTLKVIHFCGCLHELPTIGRRGMVERDPTVLSSVNSEGNFYWYIFVVVYMSYKL